ncbi:MAG: tyrosine--tRNA ligase [Elusimicrobia bacterium]|nr:tyrosine--tRNA ligase [Elusimicrobiota bacterium]
MEKEFLQKIKRGTVEIISEEELSARLSKKKHLRIKLGVDPTSPDLHLGHTVLLRKLRQFQDFGHTVVFLIGDFTAQIGDPSGQDKTRPIMTEEKILENAKTYQEQVFRILDKNKTEVRFNSEWLNALGVKGILKLASKYTVARMLERDDFSQRFKNNTPITTLEFMYPLLQGYDSVALKADIELGGNDQKFNLLVGRELQRDDGQEAQVVMTMPLLVGTDGVKKMSKSYKNYVALNDTPKDMFGKIMSIPDDVMGIYYELLTDEDLENVKHEIKEKPRDAKVKLAQTIVKQYHGVEVANAVRHEFESVFSKKELPKDIPQFETKQNQWKPADFLVEFKLAPSKNEARRLLKQNAIEVFSEGSTEGRIIGENDNIVLTNIPTIVRAGKKNFCKVIYK